MVVQLSAQCDAWRWPEMHKANVGLGTMRELLYVLSCGISALAVDRQLYTANHAVAVCSTPSCSVPDNSGHTVVVI